MTIEPPTIFKWRHFQGKITKLCTRWYLRYGLSYQDLEETVAGYETMNMIRKGRVKGVKKGNSKLAAHSSVKHQWNFGALRPCLFSFFSLCVVSFVKDEIPELSGQKIDKKQ